MINYKNKYLKYKNKYLLLKKIQNNLTLYGGAIPTQFGTAVIFRHLMKEIKSYLWYHPDKVIKPQIDKLAIALNEVVHSEEPYRLLDHTVPRVYHDPNYLYSEKVETLFRNGLKILEDNPVILTYIKSHFNKMYTTLTTAIEQSKKEKMKILIEQPKQSLDSTKSNAQSVLLVEQPKQSLDSTIASSTKSNAQSVLLVEQPKPQIIEQIKQQIIELQKELLSKHTKEDYNTTREQIIQKQEQLQQLQQQK